MSYTQLTEEHRIEIYAMLKAGLKQYQIAAQIGCHPSTICVCSQLLCPVSDN